MRWFLWAAPMLEIAVAVVAWWGAFHVPMPALVRVVFVVLGIAAVAAAVSMIQVNLRG